MLKIVALTGSKGSGKDTVGQLIASTHDNVQTIAFADPIKNVINHIFKLDPNNNNEYDVFKREILEYRAGGIPKAIAARHVVREIGMLMRDYDDKQFNIYVENQIKAQPDKLWVVTDLRFDNEYSMLKRIGAKVVKITRPAYSYDGHITEREFNDSLVDKVLMNDGSLEHLTMRTNIIMKQLLQEWE
jgi:hypothetical protein